VDFPSTLRDYRNRRHISQLELAARAGTTQRHLSFIESGRSAPGRALVVRLAESLELPLRERNTLLHSAGFVPAYPETPLDDPALAPVRTAIQHVLTGHLPYPAVVVNRVGELIANNAAFALFTEGVAAELLAAPVNAYRLALHPLGLAPRIANLPEWAGHIVEGLHRESLRNPDPRLGALRTELAAYVPARVARDDYLGVAVPLQLRTATGELRLMTTVATFANAIDVTVAELRLEAFLPADQLTAKVLTERYGR
jgi:transcriptional regulator with XRE-family HTH domain